MQRPVRPDVTLSTIGTSTKGWRLWREAYFENMKELPQIELVGLPARQSRYQPLLPGSPLTGPVNSGVIHPP